MSVKNKKAIVLVVFLLLICAVGVGVYFQIGQKDNKKAVQGDATAVTPVPKKVINLVNTVTKKTKLPKDETPTVATVTDLSKLDQAFFINAAKGDKILMYIASKQVYLYRPSTDSIINKGTIEVINPETGSESGQLDATSSAQKSDPHILRVKF